MCCKYILQKSSLCMPLIFAEMTTDHPHLDIWPAFHNSRCHQYIIHYYLICYPCLHCENLKVLYLSCENVILTVYSTYKLPSGLNDHHADNFQNDQCVYLNFILTVIQHLFMAVYISWWSYPIISCHHSCWLASGAYLKFVLLNISHVSSDDWFLQSRLLFFNFCCL